VAEDPGAPHGDERVGRIRRTAAAATDKMDVVDAGAADDGAAARLSGDPYQSEKIEAEVADGRTTPALAAEQIAEMLR